MTGYLKFSGARHRSGRVSASVVVRRPKIMVIIVTEEPLFLEACTKPFCRKRRFAAREAALGEGEKLPEPARRRSAIFCTKARHQPPEPVQRRQLLQNLVEEIGRAHVGPPAN